MSGGVIVPIVPAFQSLYGPIDRNLGHYRRYSRGMIAHFARATGLRAEGIVKPFFGQPLLVVLEKP